MSRRIRKPTISIFVGKKQKVQISCAVTAQLISAFIFATHIEKKFEASHSIMRLNRLVCVIHGRKPELYRGLIGC